MSRKIVEIPVKFQKSLMSQMNLPSYVEAKLARRNASACRHPAIKKKRPQAKPGVSFFVQLNEFLP
jgi:hypothetical protein